jgi:hypothetical protein
MTSTHCKREMTPHKEPLPDKVIRPETWECGNGLSHIFQASFALPLDQASDAFFSILQTVRIRFSSHIKGPLKIIRNWASYCEHNLNFKMMWNCVPQNARFRDSAHITGLDDNLLRVCNTDHVRVIYICILYLASCYIRLTLNICSVRPKHVDD